MKLVNSLLHIKTILLQNKIDIDNIVVYLSNHDFSKLYSFISNRDSRNRLTKYCTIEGNTIKIVGVTIKSKD